MQSLLSANNLSHAQKAIVELNCQEKILLEGYFGTGKTTTAIHRLLHLLINNIPAGNILLLLPQRNLFEPYQKVISSTIIKSSQKPNLETIGSLAKKYIYNYWPLIPKSAGFSNLNYPITFLNIESSQYYLSKIIEPLEKKGYFSSVKIDRNRLISQILDSLNKSASVGFPHSAISKKLINSWTGEHKVEIAYQEAQEAINLFREFCLKHNLLDFSLQIELFSKYLSKDPIVLNHLKQYKHIIYDNIEEDIPVTHDLVLNVFNDLESALLILDRDGGYRSFLGADPKSAIRLKDKCNNYTLTEQWSSNNELLKLDKIFSFNICKTNINDQAKQFNCLSISHHYYYPEMISWIANKTIELTRLNVLPNKIAILAPFLNDALKFLLEKSIQRHNICTYTNRPSRTILSEPIVRCILSISKIAHPQWDFIPSQQDICNALMLSIKDLDLIRASLLTKIVYHKNSKNSILTSFNNIDPSTGMQERISFLIGERFETLREWLSEYSSKEELPIDIFIGQLFGEVLSQPGYGLHNNNEGALLVSHLIDSIKEFRIDISFINDQNISQMNIDYINFLENGIIASQYTPRWSKQPENAILLSPANTFVMMNKSVDYQFWIDVGNLGWWERLDQPLTHPYVLSRNWDDSSKWTDTEDYETNQYSMARLCSGLIHRCNKHIYICTTTLNEQGSENKGPLLRVIQNIIRDNQISLETDEI